MKKRGFTLIELLVVIAIIAILAAILFPVFAKARDRAQGTACLNNMKQLSTAFLTYFQDSDDHFPPFTGNGVWGSQKKSEIGWSERLYPYIRSLDVYRCPSNNVSNFSYSMNALSSSATSDDPDNPGGGVGTLSRVKSPSKFIHLVECPGKGQRQFPIILGKVNDPRTGDSDLTTEANPQDPFGTDQKDGVVYTNKYGTVTNTPHADAMPISAVRDGILKNSFQTHPGQLFFPGWHGSGNNVMFLDGHVRHFQAWDSGAMTFDPTVQ